MCKKEKAIGTRVFQLSQLREKLVLARSDRDRALAELRTAAERLEVAPHPDGVDWPSPNRLRELRAQIREDRKDADRIIRELSALGVDAGLFKLNGEDKA